MKVINPYFYAYLFFNSTIFFPIVINGIRILSLWYSPLSDTGQITFLAPFTEFILVYVLISLVIGYYLYKYRRNRFVLVRGEFTIRNIIKSLLKDKNMKLLFIIYSIAYYISFLIVGGVLLIPNINISPYFLRLTIISYEAYGINVYFNFLVLNTYMIVLGIINTIILTIAFILSYYLVSLIYVSSNLTKWSIPKSFRLTSLNVAGGFLTASVPSIGTIAGICCLTPTAINSLLYLASASLPFLNKSIVWKYTILIGASWITSLLQIVLLSSPVFAGIAILSLSTYSLLQITKRLRDSLWLKY